MYIGLTKMKRKTLKRQSDLEVSIPFLQRTVDLWRSDKRKENHFELLGSINQRRQWHPTPVLLPGKSHGRRSLVGCSPWGHEGLDTTERLPFHFSLSCIREGNGNPFQCSCLENPKDGGAWWASVYGVAQSRTQLKLLSNSSSALFVKYCFTLITSNYC